MKHRFRNLGVVIAALFALSAIAAGSAMAEETPEFSQYPVHFTSTSGNGTLETVTHETVKCVSDTNTGDITGPRTVNHVVVTFSGCQTTFFGFPISCHTPNQSSGVIQTAELEGELWYADGVTKAATDLHPESGTSDAEFECLGNTVNVTGSVVGYFASPNVELEETELVLNQSGGIQELTGYEVGVEACEPGEEIEDTLSSSKNGETPVQSGEETHDTIKVGTPVAVIAPCI